jgi:hypothetical protein
MAASAGRLRRGMVPHRNRSVRPIQVAQSGIFLGQLGLASCPGKITCILSHINRLGKLAGFGVGGGPCPNERGQSAAWQVSPVRRVRTRSEAQIRKSAFLSATPARGFQ